MSWWLHPERPAASGLELQEGQFLHSASSVYSVVELIGEGSFGKVVQCRNEKTFETVAIKVLKEDKVEAALDELLTLEAISVLDADSTNLVKFFGSFVNMGHLCLTFELLEINLYDLVQLNDYKPLCPSDIRTIGEQLLVAVGALQGLDIIHADIKPDNVMLVDAMRRPLRAKLVDFGEAARVSEVYPGLELQPLGYRAPEVCLGLPFTEAIDVWGVGCVLAFLYLAGNLFHVQCEYQMMRSIVAVLGQPHDHHLEEGGYTTYFFTKEVVDDNSRWRLMTPEEYMVLNNMPVKKPESYLPSCLDELVETYPVLDDAELEDCRALIDLLKGLLHLNGEQRLTPREALKHTFITMTYKNQDPHSQPFEGKMCTFEVEEPTDTSSSSHHDPQDSDSGTFELPETVGDNAAVVCILEVKDNVLCEEEASECSAESETEGSEDKDNVLREEEASECSAESETEGSEDKDNVLHEEEASECSAESETEDVPSPSPSFTGRFKQVRKRIHNVFKKIQALFCCCLNPQTD